MTPNLNKPMHFILPFSHNFSKNEATRVCVCDPDLFRSLAILRNATQFQRAPPPQCVTDMRLRDIHINLYMDTSAFRPFFLFFFAANNLFYCPDFIDAIYVSLTYNAYLYNPAQCSAVKLIIIFHVDVMNIWHSNFLSLHYIQQKYLNFLICCWLLLLAYIFQPCSTYMITQHRHWRRFEVALVACTVHVSYRMQLDGTRNNNNNNKWHCHQSQRISHLFFPAFIIYDFE